MEPMLQTDMEQPGFERIVGHGGAPVHVASGLTFGEGPLWNEAEGSLYWVDIVGDTIWKWTPNRGQEIVLRPSGKANGLTLDLQGRLLIAGWGSRCIWRRECDGTFRSLVTHYNGVRINTPNDIVVRSDGSIYWTDSSGALFIPGMSAGDIQRYLGNHPVFCLERDECTVRAVVDDVSYPNGLCFSPDESVLYVNDTWQGHIRAFDVDADGGGVRGGDVLYSLVGVEPGVADGMKVDREGHVYVTGPGGIHVLEATGKLLGRIRIAEHVTNMAWGDSDWKSLYVTTYHSVYRFRLGIPGIPVGPRQRQP